MITSKLNLPLPGGWSKDTPSGQNSPNDLAAGVVGESGKVLDQSGKPVALITEGDPMELVGCVVASTGDVINGPGDVVGKAEALPQEEADIANAQPEQEKGGVDVKGVARNLKGAYDSVNKISGAGRLAGRLGGGLGFGSQKGGSQKGAESDAGQEKAEGEDGAEGQNEEPQAVTGDGDASHAGVSELDGSEVDAPDEFKDAEGGDEEGGAPINMEEKSQADGERGQNPEEEPAGEEAEGEKTEDEEPFDYSVLKDCEVNKTGNVVNSTGDVIGRLVEGKLRDLVGRKADENGDIRDDSGNIIGKAEPIPQEEEEEETPDYSVLKDCKINKAGNVVNPNGSVVGRVAEGALKDLVGRRPDENGDIWNDSGKKIGKAEPVPLEEAKEPAPFEDFPDAVVESNGTVTFEGSIVGRVIEGDPKKLKGKKVDEDGDILDRAGNALGKAERWEKEEPEPEPEEVIDNSALAGKRVNKVGNVVDPSGTIYGRLVEGDAKRLAGRMCDKDGNVRSESGDVIGRAELVTEGEREGFKEGPFAELPGCTVTKEGKVATSAGDIVGRLTQGDGKTLFGRAVDEDGDVLDRNGNTIGKAERWEEPEEEVSQNPMNGRKVNREGNVVDADGNIIGKLTSGELTVCSGKQIDNDGDVVDRKGTTVGHVSLLEDIPEPTETEEEKAKREQDEEDTKLAKRMAACLEGCLDKIRPICSMITERTEKADRTPAEELDEEALVKEVRPLIEEGHKILQESNGIIRGLDPDGHIQANAKHKTAGREASPAEYHLADLIKELTGTVSSCIDGAKKKIQDMPHAKKELNPLWGLLTEPLGQIIAAVGLLLNGVLELVGRLLNGLGLGGLVNNVLGGLGLTSVLKSLGVGSIVDAVTGQKGKK